MVARYAARGTESNYNPTEGEGHSWDIHGPNTYIRRNNFYLLRRVCTYILSF